MKIRRKNFPFCQQWSRLPSTIRSEIHEEINKTLVLSRHSLTTRAVHVEVVPGLEADAYLAAVTRSIAQRGKPNIIISDDGSNFVVAVREMDRSLESLRY